jgi:hypothetical protein
MACFFAILCALALWRAASWFWPAIFAGTSAAFAVTAVSMPKLLQPLNALWFRFGLLLHLVINPLVMGAVFFGVITPIALIMRALGKHPVPLRADKTAKSYWIVREQQPGAMTRQY